METYVALFRGLNVGGSGILPMKELGSLLENIGLRDVETYIQSGNAVFGCVEEDAPLLSGRITAAIKERHGFEPHVLLLRPEELENVVESNPFPEAESEPRTLHVHFLVSAPEHPDLEALDGIKGERERYVLKDGVFYLHAPGGLGRSKLAANTEKLLGVPTTSRNWRTVTKVLAMAKERGR
jgi:uncharacterized protein (DUF1697 family)